MGGIRFFFFVLVQFLFVFKLQVNQMLVSSKCCFCDAFVFQENLVWVNLRSSTACSSPICIKTENCSTQRVSRRAAQTHADTVEGRRPALCF